MGSADCLVPAAAVLGFVSLSRSVMAWRGVACDWFDFLFSI